MSGRFDERVETILCAGLGSGVVRLGNVNSRPRTPGSGVATLGACDNESRSAVKLSTKEVVQDTKRCGTLRLQSFCAGG
jgi:hypothetical protein